MEPTKRLKHIYIILMGIHFIIYMYFYFFGIEHQNIPIIVWAIRITTAFIAIYLGKLWRDKGFILLFLYLCYKIIRLMIANSNSIFYDECAEKILAGLWLCAGCYGMAHILNTKELKFFFQIFTIIWTIGITISCLVGLYVAWTDKVVLGPGAGEWSIYAGRLRLIFVSTVSGSILSLSSCIVLAYLLYGQKKLRLFYLFAFIIIMMAMALTDSRTAFLCAASGMGLVVNVSIQERMRKKGRKRIEIISLGIISSIAIVAFVIICLVGFIPLFNHLKIRGGRIISSAFAETIDKTKMVIDNRGFFNEGTLALNGRAEIWQMTIDYLKNKPFVLLFGNTISGPLLAIRHVNYYSHVHNMLLQTIVENGIVGTLPLLAFVFIVAVRSARVFFDEKASKWEKITVSIMVSIWIGEMTECYAWFKASQCLIGAVLFLAMGIIYVYGRKDSGTRVYKNAFVNKSIFGDNCLVGDFCRIEDSTFGNFSWLYPNGMVYSSSIGDYSYAQKNTSIWHASIGKFCSVSWNVSIGGGEHDFHRVTTHSILYAPMYGYINEPLYNRFSKPCIIGNDVWIGAGAHILRGVKVGDGAVIAAGAIVTKNVQPYSIVAGVPAKKIGQRCSEHLIKRLLDVKWWDFSDEFIRENINAFNDYLSEETVSKFESLRKQINEMI